MRNSTPFFRHFNSHSCRLVLFSSPTPPPSTFAPHLYPLARSIVSSSACSPASSPTSLLLPSSLFTFPRTLFNPSRLFSRTRPFSSTAMAPTLTSKDGKFVYPSARRDNDISDTFHGVKVPAPYRWLEDPDSEETTAFINSQNKLTRSYIDQFPYREKYNARLTELFNYERFACPFRRGDYFYYFHNTGLQGQNVLYQQDSIDSEPRVFFDPNTLEADGTAALGAASFSHSGKLFGYSIAKSGSDWVTIMLQDNQGNKLPDVISWAKFTGIDFTHDEKGFFYSSYPKPDIEDGKAGTETGKNEFMRLNYHRIGTNQSEDILVHVDLKNPTYMPHAEVSDDGKYIIKTIGKNTDPINNLYIVDLEAAGGVKSDLEWTTLSDDFSARYSYLTNEGTVFYFQTNKDAPRYKVVKYDLSQPSEGFTDVVPEVEDVLSGAQVVNGNILVLQYMHDVKDCLYAHDLVSGKLIEQIDVPIGTISGISGRKEDTEIFFSYTSYLSPGTIYRYDFKEQDSDKRRKLFKQAEVKNFNADLFETKQIFFESKDGTKIPMFVTAKKDVKLDGNNPVFLYGYGGFSIPIQAAYSPSVIAFIQHFNGVAAFVNLRGGGEYGEDYHQAGVRFNKHNVFEDFQWAAKYLIKEKYTQPKKIVINGGSNGGLLVGACLNAAPELFGAAVADVGVHDMLHYQNWTIGKLWASDFGNADETEEDFKNLYSYSPVHNVSSDGSRPYPPTLLTTSDHDDRVVPAHSYLFIAALQHTAGPLTNSPLCIRVETKAGHGAGKPIKKRIEETTDKFSFIGLALEAEWSD